MTTKTDKYEGMRIYTVVPGTVQTPIKVTYTPKQGNVYSFGRFTNTRDIVQPAGRQAAQVGHARAMVEHELVMRDLTKVLYGTVKRSGNSTRFSTAIRDVVPYHAITGIVLQARDSFELIHVGKLLKAAGIKYFEFHDSQEDLYEDVVTALSTEPVTPFAIAGILDYLPLWTGK